MPAGPHLRSIRGIRQSLEEIPDAIRYEDPLTEHTGAGFDPAVEVPISRPDDSRSQADAPGLDADDESQADSDEGPADEPTVTFEISPEESGR
jgi:hypothetical protein